MRVFHWIVLCLLTLAGSAAPGLLRAEPRIALVIGNGAYEAVSPLTNPLNDAGLMARTLEELGFEVTLVGDADLGTMQGAISAFGRSLRDAGEEATGLFYYAGHGVQSFGRNYILPVDASLTDAADLSLVAIEAEAVLRQMASARNRTNIFILDACRNNPFPDSVGFGETGLAEMNAPAGTYIAYATSPVGWRWTGRATTARSPRRSPARSRCRDRRSRRRSRMCASRCWRRLGGSRRHGIRRF